MSEARRLTVAHQKPGECAYCDERHAKIVAAVAHELAEKIRLHKDEARGAVQATKVVAFCADLIDPAVE